jgi:hypothetical protein
LIRKCKRCGIEEKKQEDKPVHNWDDWKLNEQLNIAIRICRNCGKTETKDAHISNNTQLTTPHTPSVHTDIRKHEEFDD